MLASHVMEGNSSTELSYSLSREAKAPILFSEQYLRNIVIPVKKNPQQQQKSRANCPTWLLLHNPLGVPNNHLVYLRSVSLGKSALLYMVCDQESEQISRI